MNALNHFRNVQMLGGYAASKGVPAPQAMVVLTGVLLLVGGLSILFGAYPTVGVAAVVVFLVVVAFWMHNFWTVQDPMQRMGEMVNFNKNLALAGSALMFHGHPPALAPEPGVVRRELGAPGDFVIRMPGVRIPRRLQPRPAQDKGFKLPAPRGGPLERAVCQQMVSTQERGGRRPRMPRSTFRKTSAWVLGAGHARARPSRLQSPVTHRVERWGV
jgi:putative oxidoreductase